MAGVGKPNNVISIPTSFDNFFKYWFNFLKPFHKMTDREIDVISAFLKKRHALSKVVQDKVLLERITMSDDTKREVREECGLSSAHFQLILSKLKKKGAISDSGINPKFIPKLTDKGDHFQLLLLFTFK